MKKYNHPYKDGDIVTDSEFNEVFFFEDGIDGFKAENNPDAFRLATEDERKLLLDSGEEVIEL